MVKLSRHKSVQEADPYAFQVAHRRLAWMLRLATGMVVVLGVAVISMTNLITELVPLKTTEIALVKADPADDRIYRIEPISEDVNGVDLLMESAARRYVRLLLEIDSITQDERFREAAIMSDRAFYKRFGDARFGEVQKAIDSGLVRSVTVESVDRVDSFGQTYKFAVDFRQIDKIDGDLIEERKLRAYLNLTFRPSTVSERNKYENPLGITVLDLVLKERANS